MKKNVIRTIGLSAIFLFMFIIIIQLYTNILFLMNISITPWHLPVEFGITILIFGGIYLFLAKKQKESIKKVLIQIISSICIGALVFTIAVYCVGKIYDITSDGNTYHKLGVGSMKNGWNPLYESSRDFTEEDGNALTVSEDNINYLWADHYAMGTETIGANIYAFSNNIESGKAFTLVMMFIGFGITLEYLVLQRDWISKKFGVLKALVISALLVVNPITVVQMGTYYVDATLAISLFLIIIELIAINTKNKENLFENYFILAMSIGMCANAKFTGLGYAAVFCAAFYIYGIIKNRKDKKYIIRNTVFYVITVIITVCVLGGTSYLKNMIGNGHPFYPLYGEGHVENMVNQEIPESLAVKPNIVQFFISVFSKGENISPSYSDILNEPDLKVPFTIQEGEIENYSIPDIRVSGFGPLYSGIFLITVGVGIAILVDYIRNKKYDSLIKYLIIIGVSAVLLIALDGSYWARYVPYVYLISAMNLAYLFEKNTKVSNILGIVIAVIMAINSALVLKVALNNYIGNSKYVKNNLIQFQEYAKDKEKIPIKLNLDTYQGVQYNLDDLGIDIILDNSITSERDGFLFKY